MRFILALGAVLMSFSAFAQSVPAGDKCEKYHNIPRYMAALEVVATNAKWKLEEMCNLERIWDIQAEPAIVINRQGEEIPHIRVQLHRNEDSCLYMVRESDLVVTQKRCFSTY